MANAHISGTGDLAAPVNFVLMDTFLRRANQALVYFALTDPGRLNKHSGSLTVKWRRYEQATPTTTPLSEPTGNLSVPLRAAITPSLTDVTAAVAKFGQYYLLDEELDVVNPGGYEDELMNIMGQVAGRSLNRLCRDEMEGNATAIRVGGAAANGNIVSALTIDSMRKGVRVLKGNSALKFTASTTGSGNFGTSPINDAFMAINHTDVSADVMGMPNFKPKETYAGQTSTLPNEIGYVDRVRFLETEEASTSASTGGSPVGAGLISTNGANADLYNTIVAGQYAVGSVGLEAKHPDTPKEANDRIATVDIIVHDRGTSGVGDALDELATIGWKAWAKFKITNTGWIRRVVSGATNYQ